MCGDGLKCVLNVCRRRISVNGVDGVNGAVGGTPGGRSGSAVRGHVIAKLIKKKLGAALRRNRISAGNVVPPKAGACSQGGETCTGHLVCAGPRSARRCVKPKKIGDRCGQDPFWVCQRDLTCVGGYCRVNTPRGVKIQQRPGSSGAAGTRGVDGKVKHF